jgi:hypothetical protein
MHYCEQQRDKRRDCRFAKVAGKIIGSERPTPHRRISKSYLRPSLYTISIAVYVRRVRKKARMSAANNSGSSAAAKWPPLGISVQR